MCFVVLIIGIFIGVFIVLASLRFWLEPTEL